MEQLVENGFAVEREILRFIDVVCPGRPVLYRERRSAIRYHRCAPIFVANLDALDVHDYRATLDNISVDGLGFLVEGDDAFPVGSLLAVKFFWSDPHALRVPAVVRHVEKRPHPHAVFVGAKFAHDDLALCDRVAEAIKTWYG